MHMELNQHRKRLIIGNSRGFTVAEVMMAVFIFSLLATACYTIMASSSSSWQTNRVRMEIQQELRKGQSWMINELRQTGTSVITDVPVATNVTTGITFR